MAHYNIVLLTYLLTYLLCVKQKRERIVLSTGLPVDVVAEEEIVSSRWMSVRVQVTQQVVILSVYVAADRHWNGYL